MQVYMQLALFFQALQTDHNILVTTWHNYQAWRNSSFPSLWGKHDPQHWTPYSPYAYLHSFSICPGLLSDSSWSLQPLTPFPWVIMVQAQSYSLGYPKSLVSYTFFHTKLHTDSSPRMIAWMHDVSAVPDRRLHLCMINVHVCMFKHSVYAIFMPVHVYGALSPGIEA